MSEIVIAGMMPNENWFNSARVVIHPKGISPCLTSVGGGIIPLQKFLKLFMKMIYKGQTIEPYESFYRRASERFFHGTVGGGRVDVLNAMTT